MILLAIGCVDPSIRTPDDEVIPVESDSPADTDVDTDDTDVDDTDVPADIPASVWTDGAFVAVDPGSLLPLPGAVAGPPAWVSNNPEAFTGDGWLMQMSRASSRGGRSVPVDVATVYLFHVNHSGATRTLHLLATNPGSSDATVTARGSLLSNVEAPLTGPGTGPSYRVAADALADDLTTTTATVKPGKGAQLAAISLPSNAMADGRFALTATSGVYLYTVTTSTGTLEDAINLSQGDPAAGTIASPSASTYGREAGLYSGSGWVGSATVELPLGSGHLGLCFDTDAKFARGGATLQDQTAGATAVLDDSADRTWGNYGHEYDVQLTLRNAASVDRDVTIRLVSLVQADSDSPSFTWNAPFRVDDATITAWTTPREPAMVLAVRRVQAGGERVVRVQTIVPGLISAGAALVLETAD